MSAAWVLLEPIESAEREKPVVSLSCSARVMAFVAGPLSPSVARAAEPFQIDVILSLTGAFAFLGNAEAESLRTLEAEINKQGGIKGQPIHFNILSDQTQSRRPRFRSGRRNDPSLTTDGTCAAMRCAGSVCANSPTLCSRLAERQSQA